ncbi:DUF2391 family protein [Qipengyuania marisflavi]|uniref:DUF2391 family protein n=1 Tax=Qipengyuania marisflavi TaxID=2486356 RepID=A0A5S3P555_9SPHN|nr:DUF2391 family protein [Qipengyuania marisflavi]TMM47197.1 DUF2391 family protein [Qipengyuania marisflavi]
MKLAVTGFNAQIDDDGQNGSAGVVELRDLARGMAGALFVSLPLLFTLEMWVAARAMPDLVLLAFLAITVVLNKFYLDFAGFRKTAWQSAKWWDALITLGIGIVGSAITLVVIGSLKPDIDFYLAVKLVALEAIPMSMGAAVAINQLGASDGASQQATGLSLDMKVVVGSLLGGFLFAMNIAPTMEPKLVVLQQNWYLTGATLVLSILVSYLTVGLAAFEEQDLADRKVINSAWLETAVAYAIAFLVSAVLLWIFGFSTPLDPMVVWLPHAIALAYVTALGGAAGRLVL